MPSMPRWSKTEHPLLFHAISCALLLIQRMAVFVCSKKHIGNSILNVSIIRLIKYILIYMNVYNENNKYK